MGKLTGWDILYFILVVISLPAIALTIIGSIIWFIIDGTIPIFLWISFGFWILFIVYKSISEKLMKNELKKTSGKHTDDN